MGGWTVSAGSFRSQPIRKGNPFVMNAPPTPLPDSKLEILRTVYPVVVGRVEYYYSQIVKMCVAELSFIFVVLGWKIATENGFEGTSTKVIGTILVVLASGALVVYLFSIYGLTEIWGKTQQNIEEALRLDAPGEFIPDDRIMVAGKQAYGKPKIFGREVSWPVYLLPILSLAICLPVIWL
jgi:hypothetical protein